MSSNNATRGLSQDFDDSDFDDQDDGPGKPGRKKNPNSQAARRDQNRIAQREFRLRKQQRIRDLEARVEILSGGKDEALKEMGNILKDLMQENQTLRGLLRNLASFIGEGAGGLLPKLGWEMSDFHNFINKSETDTAWEGYQRRKKDGGSGLKRAAEDEPSGSRNKKSRASDASESQSATAAAFNGLVMPMQPPTMQSQQQPPMYPPTSSHDSTAGMFDLMKSTNSSGMFAHNSNSPSTTNGNGYTSSPNIGNMYMPPGVNASTTVEPTINFSAPSSNSPSTTVRSTPNPTANNNDEALDDDDDPGKNEAYKLIHYHLDNYKRNSAYCLPSSLRPTLVQRTVPHEGVIDRILHPELRNRMILLRGRFDLVDCLLDYRRAVTIHGDDVLAHTNWEIGEKWLRQYGFLVEPATLTITNRWRRDRGEPEIRMSDIENAQDTAS